MDWRAEISLTESIYRDKWIGRGMYTHSARISETAAHVMLAVSQNGCVPDKTIPEDARDWDMV